MNESNLSFKNIFKRETKLATYIIICVTIVVISSSYALFFQVNQNSKNQEVIAGDLVFTYENGETITGSGVCFEPMTYEESAVFVSECAYRFSARNTGSLKASYTIKLVPKEENEIELTKMKVVLKRQNGETLEVVNSYPKLISELENGILIQEEVDPNSNIVYSVQVYLEEELYEDSDFGKKAMFEIVGSGVVHEGQVINTDESIAVNYITNLEKTNPEELMYDETVDNNLRYVGTNPNNYVRFNNELWRIIGVMNNMKTNESDAGESRIKLIRAESIGNYSWDTTAEETPIGSGINDWTNADAMKLLNEGYESESVGGSLYWNASSGICYNGMSNATKSCDFTTTGLKDKTSKNMIAETIWNLGGTSSYSSASNGLASHWYGYERGTNVYSGRPTTWKGKIGLIYPSDVGYATSGGITTNRKSCLQKELSNWNDSNVSDCKNNDWLYNSSLDQWTLSPDVSLTYIVFGVPATGLVYNYDVYGAYGLLPTLYLKHEVKIVGGDGSVDHPFKLSL